MTTIIAHYFFITQQKQTTDEPPNAIALSTLAQATLTPDVFYHDNKGVRSWEKELHLTIKKVYAHERKLSALSLPRANQESDAEKCVPKNICMREKIKIKWMAAYEKKHYLCGKQ